MRKLKHAKSTLAEGVSLLLWLGLIVIVVGCFQIFLFRTIWVENLPFALGFLAAEVAIGLLVVYVAIAKIRRNETFVCLMDDELIECVCPMQERGDSFRLKLDDVVRIDLEGNRHWLTDAYRNPAGKFVRRIRQLKPNLR